MDIIVTTPKGEMANAAREAEDCKRDGGGEYFRRFPVDRAPEVLPGERVYYVEDGHVRGFAVVTRIHATASGQCCDTTGRRWPPGFYVFMDATTWRWIKPVLMNGFRGFRYARLTPAVIGGWLDPKPEV
ncbi:MAG TPA: hypothetical protein VMW52_13800 [Phycisphaerae bacterium]|nr:hypothetical protein [Phycisphaerae bacterium]